VSSLPASTALKDNEMHHKVPQNIYCNLQYVKEYGAVAEASRASLLGFRTAAIRGPQAREGGDCAQATQECPQVRSS